MMRTYNAVVAGADVESGEHCRAHASDLQGIGRTVGDQVRVVRSGAHLGLYTVESALPAAGRVAMGATGRQRLRGPSGFEVVVDAQVTHPSYTDAEAECAGEFVERLLVGRGRRIAVVAPHGGDIELHTDEQADHVRRSLRSLGAWAWVCKGWGHGTGAFARWHITSTDLSARSFPLLARMLRTPFEHAVSFHGFDDTGFSGADVRVGGRAHPALKARMRDSIQERLSSQGLTVVVAGRSDPFRATVPDNVVNRLSPVSGGIQIEQSKPARKLMATEIAEAVASVYRSVLAAGGRQQPREAAPTS